MTERAERPLALVTGGAKRVGRAICLALARAGCDVRFTFRSSDAHAESTLIDLRGAGAQAHADRLDLTDLDSVAGYADRLAGELARLDVLVHNASAYVATPIDEIDAARAERLMRVHAVAPLLLTAGLRGLLRNVPQGGTNAVVAMCDIHAMDRPRAGFAAYNMSKAALAQLVLSLARDLAPAVRVNGVAPGVVRWPDEGYESDAESQRRYLSRVPLARAGTEAEAAETVRWLALDASYVTGQIIRLDGGRSLA